MSPFHFGAPVPAREGERCVTVPGKIESKTALFHFLASSIPLPDYFGHNWDALEECLGDPSWLKASRLVLGHEDIPLREAPVDQRIYLQVLAKAAQESDRVAVVFPESDRAQITQLLTTK